MIPRIIFFLKSPNKNASNYRIKPPQITEQNRLKSPNKITSNHRKNSIFFGDLWSALTTTRVRLEYLTLVWEIIVLMR